MDNPEDLVRLEIATLIGAGLSCFSFFVGSEDIPDVDRFIQSLEEIVDVKKPDINQIEEGNHDYCHYQET